MKTSKKRIAEVCALLQEYQTNRKATIKAQNKLKAQARSFVARYLGYHVGMDEKEGKALFAQAKKLVKKIETEGDTHIASVFVSALKGARTPLDEYRKAMEKEMENIVTELPICDWWVSHPGMSYGGLAVLIGEIGNLNDYDSLPKIWKRMGVAPQECYRMEKKDGTTAIAKPRQRRSVRYTIGDAVIKNNVTIDPETKKRTPAKYRSIYLWRKEVESKSHPEWVAAGKKMIIHLRAQRYMEKIILRDMWKAWIAAMKASRKAA
jgi:hypothetical protein